MEYFKQHIFKEYCDFVYQTTGIHLQAHKKPLLQSRLNKLLSRNNMTSADAYLTLISCPENISERQEFINMMTTNTTEFFREPDHFHFLRDQIDFIFAKNPRIYQNRSIRVWSAACSTGQEPITLALVLKGLLGQEYDIRILATDISTQVLSKAVSGVYSASECADIPKLTLKNYFDKSEDSFKIHEEIRSAITYRQFNLMGAHRFKWGFDIIFCRNVMIYFDNQVQQQLVNKLFNDLAPGGLLFLGHSESLINKKHSFKSIGDSIYLKG